MKAVLRNYAQSPRKVRRVVGTIQNKSVPHALGILGCLCHKSAPCLEKLIRSAVVSAEQKGITDVFSTHTVHIKIDKGVALRRIFIRARGRASPYRKTRSHITVFLRTQQSL